MVDHLVATTESIIKVKAPEDAVLKYPSPPASPGKKPISLKLFIINLIRYLNVQVPTLMTTLVYLNKLKDILPSDQIYGIPTTHHRIFVGCLILTAKYVNDSSPLNKHWARYSSGLLLVKELNVIEVEVLSYLDWDLSISTDDLYKCFAPFLEPIKAKLRAKEEEIKKKQDQMRFTLLSKPNFKSLAHSSSILLIKKMLCPPSASSASFSESVILPTGLSLLQLLSNNLLVVLLDLPAKSATKSGYLIPSLTNLALTYSLNLLLTYLLNNSSTSLLTKKMIEEDFTFVEPPKAATTKGYSPMSAYLRGSPGVKPASLFASPKNLLARMTQRLSPKAGSPQLYRISSNSSLRSNSSTKLLSPLSSFKSKIKPKKSKLTTSEVTHEATTVKCLSQPAAVKKVAVSSDNLRHFNLHPPVRA